MSSHLQEIEELTDLMRNEWLDVRLCIELLGYDPAETLLVAFAESENEMEYSIIVTRDWRIFECSRSTNEIAEIKFSKAEELPNSEETFKLTPTIKLALSIQENL